MHHFPLVSREDCRLPWALGLLAGLSVLLTLADPGITVDEPLDVRPGRRYVQSLLREGPGFFERRVVDRVFRDNAEHPPLGRWLLGLASTIGEPLQVMAFGPDPLDSYVLAGRLAPAVAFALLVGMVAAAAGRIAGRSGAVGAGFALIAMPRAFAHAHLGALDTFISLFWTLALLAALRAVESTRLSRAMTIAGGLWGLALLTKIHAWLLPPIILAWALARLPVRRALPAFGLWAIAGLAIFLLGWPWLWYDTWPRLQAFFATGLHRAPIRVLYFGRVFLDRDVPWHYPWFYFAATVPVGLHALGLLGLAHAWRARRVDPKPVFLAATILPVLLLFSLKATVYDGERLFLIVFPAWAILIGRGFAVAWAGAATRRWRRFAVASFLAAQGYGVLALHPFGLSYYNGLVGGLPGAERLGLELTYWGDAVDGRLLRTLGTGVRPGESAALAPTLAPGQGAFATPVDLLRREIVLGDEDAVKAATWVAVYRREAYWGPALRRAIADGRLVAERRRQGVRLSALYRLSRPAPGAATGGQFPAGTH